MRSAAPGSGAPAHPSHLGLVHADQTLVHLGPGGHGADVPQLVGVLCKGACLHLEKKIHSWRGRLPRSSSPDPSSKVVHVCVHACACTQTCTHTKAHTCMRVCTHRHAHVRMYVQGLGCTTWEGGDTHTHTRAHRGALKYQRPSLSLKDPQGKYNLQGHPFFHSQKKGSPIPTTHHIQQPQKNKISTQAPAGTPSNSPTATERPTSTGTCSRSDKEQQQPPWPSQAPHPGQALPPYPRTRAVPATGEAARARGGGGFGRRARWVRPNPGIQLQGRQKGGRKRGGRHEP